MEQQQALLSVIHRLAGLRAVSKEHVDALEALLSLMEAETAPKGPSLQELLAKDVVAKVLWSFVGPFRHVNAHRSRETHPVLGASKTLKQLAEVRLCLLSHDELVKDLVHRWGDWNYEMMRRDENRPPRTPPPP